MPASVGARPGTSVAAASPHQRTEAEAEAGERGEERVARRPQVAQHDDQQHDRDHEADDLSDREAAGRGAVDRLARHRDVRAGKVVRGLLEPLAGGRVELLRGLVVADRREGGVAVLGEPQLIDGGDVRLLRDLGERARSISLLGSAPCSALNTSVACVPDCVGKRCSSRSWARCDSMPGTVKSSLKAPPAAMAPPIRAREDERRRRGSCGRGRRPANDASGCEEGGHGADIITMTEFKNQLSLFSD